MQTGYRRDYQHRTSGGGNSGNIHTSGRIGRITRFDYVNRSSQSVHPKTGKPYDRQLTGGRNSGAGAAASAENGSSRSSHPNRLPVKQRGAMFGGLDPIPTDPTRDPPPRVCYNCWQKGHARRECSRPIVSRFCNNCGRRGEDLRSCPRCRRAHERYLAHMQARERGEELDPDEIEQLLPESEYEEEAEEVEEEEVEEVEEEEEDACDEVLRELIMQDERNRQMNNGGILRTERTIVYQQGEQPRERKPTQQERHIGLTVFQERDMALASHRGREREPPPLMSQYHEREERPKHPYGEQERRSGGRDREREIAKNNAYEESDIELLYERERERNREREKERERERERESGYQARPGRPENNLSSRWKGEPSPTKASANYGAVSKFHQQVAVAAAVAAKAAPSASVAASVSSDPVQDILLLAKTIAHLPPDTQDLIMRQVIAERKERARLMAGQGCVEETWP